MSTGINTLELAKLEPIFSSMRMPIMGAQLQNGPALLKWRARTACCFTKEDM